MDFLEDYLPKESCLQINIWIKRLDIKLKITSPRKTKLGDFKGSEDGLFISINNDLNPYSFLITLTHELAHAFVYIRHLRGVNPHGSEWQNEFRIMMLNFLSPKFFPDDLLKPLSVYLKKPKASTLSDLNLAVALKKYDYLDGLIISDIEYGSLFSISNGNKFIRGPKLRKRYKCVEYNNNKVYLFHPLAKVFAVE